MDLRAFAKESAATFAKESAATFLDEAKAELVGDDQSQHRIDALENELSGVRSQLTGVKAELESMQQLLRSVKVIQGLPGDFAVRKDDEQRAKSEAPAPAPVSSKKQPPAWIKWLDKTEDIAQAKLEKLQKWILTNPFYFICMGVKVLAFGYDTFDAVWTGKATGTRTFVNVCNLIVYICQFLLGYLLSVMQAVDFDPSQDHSAKKND